LGSEVGNFFPGIPLELARTFFEKRSYSFNPDPVHDLARSLADWQVPPTPTAVQNGEYFYTQGHEGEQAAILGFLRQPSTGFSPRWPFLLERWFGQGYAPANVTLLKRASGEIAGFCQTWSFAKGWFEGCPRTLLYWARAELPAETHASLGPLGVDSSVRGGGLGLGLVAAATNFVWQQGATFATIDWTDLTEFYGKLGYLPWRSYLYGQKD
jgi:GNAT superfamily N-acetyltransferase